MKNLLFVFFVLLVSVLSAQNNPPVAVNDTVFDTVYIGSYVSINVTANDYDPDGDVIIVQPSSFNTFTVESDSTIRVFLDYSMAGGSPQTMQFLYSIKDSNGLPGNSAQVIINTIIDKSFSFLDANNISARFNAYGNHFWDMTGGIGAQYYYPKNTPHTSIFNFAFWLGGMDENNQLRLAGERYRQQGSDYWTGPLSYYTGNVWTDTTIVSKYFNIWKLTKEEVEYHILHWNDPGYEPIENILNWPAHGDPDLNQSFYLAPFVDVNGDSIYEPMQGDYPLIRGDQTLFFIFNDQKTHTETDGEPIGVEIHGFAYAFDAPDNPELNNTTFLSYKIFNRSQHTLTDTYAGLFCDIDLGYAWDDFIGCDVARGTFYGYNGDDDDNGGPESYGLYPPAQGVIVLGGPYMDPDGIDNPTGGCDESINGVGFGDGIADNERFGMNNFIYFNNGGTYSNDPQIAYQYYNYLKGIWIDSTVMEYGGNGHPSSGSYGPAAHFMFPGLSDPCNWGTNGITPYGPVEWTEVTAGNSPSDRRGLCSMGPFTLEPGGFEKIDIAFITARGDSLINSVDLLKTYIDSVKTFYYQDPDHFGYQYLGEKDFIAPGNEFSLFPNPATNHITIDLPVTSANARYIIYNRIGEAMMSGDLPQGIHHNIPTASLANGLYILKIIDRGSVVTRKFIKK